MKTKNILIGILSLLTFVSYGQTEKKNGKKVEAKTVVTELKVETENLDELTNFDWDVVKEMFKENDSEQEITLAFVYTNNSDIDNSKVRVDDFEFKVTGKSSELDKLTNQLQKSFSKLAEIDGMNKN